MKRLTKKQKNFEEVIEVKSDSNNITRFGFEKSRMKDYAQEEAEEIINGMGDDDISLRGLKNLLIDVIRRSEERMIERCAEIAEGCFYADDERKCGCIPQNVIANAIRKLKEDM